MNPYRAKMNLIGAYMEVYNHVTKAEDALEFKKLITNIMSKRPRLDLNDSYFGSSYESEDNSTQIYYIINIHAQIHTSILKYLTYKHACACLCFFI